MPGGLVMVKGVFDKVPETEESKTFLKLNKETDNNNKKRQRKLKAELRDTNLVERPGI